jgi:hypothetical protein
LHHRRPAAVIDSRGVAEGTAQGFEIPHDAVAVDKGVTNGVANEVGNADDLAAFVDARGAAEVTAEASQVGDGITALRFVGGHLPGSSAQQQLTNQSRRYYQI